MNCIQEAPPFGSWSDSERAVLARAMALLESRIVQGPALCSPSAVHDYLRCRLAGLEYETLGAIWLTSGLRVLSVEELFRGTLTHTPVHTRELLRRALQLNAGGLVLFHNHPSSGDPEPSKADQRVTELCKSALALIDVKLVDHIVVCAAGAVSMGDRGLL